MFSDFRPLGLRWLLRHRLWRILTMFGSTGTVRTTSPQTRTRIKNRIPEILIEIKKFKTIPIIYFVRFLKSFFRIWQFSEKFSINQPAARGRGRSTPPAVGSGSFHSKRWWNLGRTAELFYYLWTFVNAGAYDFTFLCMCSGFAGSGWVDVFGKNQRKIQQFLTKLLRLENGAKVRIV